MLRSVLRSSALQKPLNPVFLRTHLAASARPSFAARYFSLKRPEGDYENEIFTRLEEAFKPTQLIVQDVSGGCGSMFAIRIESAEFKGLSPVKQQQLVYKVLGDEIAKWHGLQLRTIATK